MLLSIPMPMKNILRKFDDCNKFSITGKVFNQIVKITKEEYEQATEKMNLQGKKDFLEKKHRKNTNIILQKKNS